jgi:hypothetical protein
MPKIDDQKAWIFVSHASADLEKVRHVRNLLEERGASPLLFYLMALENPEEFWPIIEREITARNFFLYCESPAAELSYWVQKERAAVEKARREHPKSVGVIRVDGPEIDEHALDEFVARTRVFPSYANRDHTLVAPFLSALTLAGFAVYDKEAYVNFTSTIGEEMLGIAKNGWIVAFISQSSLESPYVGVEMGHALTLGTKFVPVLLEPVPLPPSLETLRCFDAYSDPASAPFAFTKYLLDRKRS